MEEIETNQPNSDESSAASSEPQSAAGDQHAESSQEQSAQQSKEDNVPFHEHPRFKELVEQKNTAAKQVEELQKEIASIRSGLQNRPSQTTQQEKDALIERLKQIDPEFGSRFEKLNGLMPKLEQIEQWRQQMEADNSRRAAVSQIQQLHTQYKVPESLRVRYEREIRAIAAENPQLQLADLPKVYKQVHDDYSAMLDGLKRAERESYLTNKKQDASAPVSQPRGKPVNPNKGEQLPTNPDDLQRWTRDEVLKELRRARNS